MTSGATLANASEAKVVTVDLRDDFVSDIGATRGLSAQSVTVQTGSSAEVVDSEGLVTSIDELDHILDVSEGEYGEHWSEDLLCHKLGV